MPSRKGLAPIQLMLIIAVLIWVVGYGSQSVNDLIQSSMDKSELESLDVNLTDEVNVNTTTQEEPTAEAPAYSVSSCSTDY